MTNDPREMRKRLTRVCYGRERLDGKPLRPLCFSLVHNIMRIGEANGWSGEDTMTALAYHLLLDNERLYDIVSQDAMLNPAPLIFQLQPQRDSNDRDPSA